MLAIVWCASYHKRRYFRESGIYMYICQYVPHLVYIPINIFHICYFHFTPACMKYHHFLQCLRMHLCVTCFGLVQTMQDESIDKCDTSMGTKVWEGEMIWRDGTRNCKYIKTFMAICIGGICIPDQHTIFVLIIPFLTTFTLQLLQCICHLLALAFSWCTTKLLHHAWLSSDHGLATSPTMHLVEWRDFPVVLDNAVLLCWATLEVLQLLLFHGNPLLASLSLSLLPHLLL